MRVASKHGEICTICTRGRQWCVQRRDYYTRAVDNAWLLLLLTDRYDDVSQDLDSIADVLDAMESQSSQLQAMVTDLLGNDHDAKEGQGEGSGQGDAPAKGDVAAVACVPGTAADCTATAEATGTRGNAASPAAGR